MYLIAEPDGTYSIYIENKYFDTISQESAETMIMAGVKVLDKHE